MIHLYHSMARTSSTASEVDGKVIDGVLMSASRHSKYAFMTFAVIIHVDPAQKHLASRLRQPHPQRRRHAWEQFTESVAVVLQLVFHAKADTIAVVRHPSIHAHNSSNHQMVNCELTVSKILKKRSRENAEMMEDDIYENRFVEA